MARTTPDNQPPRTRRRHEAPVPPNRRPAMHTEQRPRAGGLPTFEEWLSARTGTPAA